MKENLFIFSRTVKLKQSKDSMAESEENKALNTYKISAVQYILSFRYLPLMEMAAIMSIFIMIKIKIHFF